MVRSDCVLVAGIHPARTRTSRPFESVRWNVCIRRLDLGLYSHPKEVLGNGIRTHVNTKTIIPSTGKSRGRLNLRRCITLQHATDWAVGALNVLTRSEDNLQDNKEDCHSVIDAMSLVMIPCHDSFQLMSAMLSQDSIALKSADQIILCDWISNEKKS